MRLKIIVCDSGMRSQKNFMYSGMGLPGGRGENAAKDALLFKNAAMGKHLRRTCCP